MVFRGFTTIWSLATLPTSRSPLSLIATTLGRISEPLSLGTTRATLFRTYATHVFVVPRSMPSRMGLSAGMKLDLMLRRSAPGAQQIPLLPPHVVPHNYTCRPRIHHLRDPHLSHRSRQLVDEHQRPAQDVKGGVGCVRTREPRQDRSALLTGLPGKGDAAGDHGKEAIEVGEDR